MPIQEIQLLIEVLKVFKQLFPTGAQFKVGSLLFAGRYSKVM